MAATGRPSPLRLPEDIDQALQVLAQATGRSKANAAAQILREYLEIHGLLKGEGRADEARPSGRTDPPPGKGAGVRW